jgi:type I restriction enzyme, S subunit
VSVPWKKVRLIEAAELNPVLPEQLTSDQEVSFVPMSAVSAETAAVENEEKRTYSEVAKGFTRFVDGDVLVAKITPCFENGKIVQANLSLSFGFGSTEFHVVRPRPTKLNARYILHFLRQLPVRKAGERRMSGSAGQRRVPESFLSNLEIPLPPLEEQRRIAEILDRANALHAKRRAALAQLDSLTRSIFLELFGDPVTNPKHWERKFIYEIGKVITGNTPPRANSDYYGTYIEWIKSDNINTPNYYLTKAAEGLSKAGKAMARIAPAGSILVTCIAGSPECIGNAALTDREVAFNQQINALVPFDGNPHFLYAQLLVGKHLVQGASTSGMKGLVSKGRFEQIKLIYPPVPLQREFAGRVVAVEKLRGAQRASLAELDNLFASLQHRAFRGEL